MKIKELIEHMCDLKENGESYKAFCQTSNGPREVRFEKDDLDTFDVNERNLEDLSLKYGIPYSDLAEVANSLLKWKGAKGVFT